MMSYWQQTAPPIETDPFRVGSEVDVVIVGAGITGIAVAGMLAGLGVDALVLEARSVGAGATGNTTGKVSLLQGTVLGDLRRHAGDATLLAYVEANRAAQDWLTAKLRALGVEVQRRDAVTYAISEDGSRKIERELAAATIAGLDLALTSEPGLPFMVHSAIRLPGQAQIHAMQMLAALTVDARRSGARVVEGVRVLGVDAASPCVVTTSRGDVRADRVILATGVPILDRGLFFAKVDALRSYAAAYELPSEEHLPVGMFLSADEPRRSLRTVPGESGEVLIAGGGGHITGRRADTRAEVDALDAWTLQHWPKAMRIARWSAQDHRTHTRVQFAGVVPRSGDRVLAATGYNKWGMTNAVAAAMTLRGLMYGDVPSWAATLAADRPGPTDAGETVGANADVAARLVAGWAELVVAPGMAADAPGEGEGEIRRDGVRPVAVSTVDGVTCAVSGVCTHLGGVLGWNAAERSWDCPLHGSRFDPRGTLLEGPAVQDLAPASATGSPSDSADDAAAS